MINWSVKGSRCRPNEMQSEKRSAPNSELKVERVASDEVVVEREEEKVTRTGVVLCALAVGACPDLVELAQELADGRYTLGLEVVYPLRVDGDADAPGFGVHAEGRFEQVVAVFRDFGVETGVRVLQDDVFSGSLQFLWGVIVTPLETE